MLASVGTSANQIVGNSKNLNISQNTGLDSDEIDTPAQIPGK